MTSQQIADELLRHWWLLWPLSAAERAERVEEIYADIVFEEQLKNVAREMMDGRESEYRTSGFGDE
jgi:hypothetical protein